ncbi:MAG: glycosyltransferase family 39 protein, partial [Deltaproteobacteria bacterium]
ISIVLFVLLTARGIGMLGVFYEEVVSFTDVPQEIVSRVAHEGGLMRVEYADGRERDPSVVAPATPLLVPASMLPHLSVRYRGHQYPLLDQIYMTNHVAYLSWCARWISPVWGVRTVHALFGVIGLVLLFVLGRSLFDSETARTAVVLAPLGLNYTFMFTWARYDESIASVGTLAVLVAVDRYRREGKERFLAVALFLAALTVSGKITALWTLGAAGLAAIVAGKLPRPKLRGSAVGLLTGAVCFLPLILDETRMPGGTNRESARRLAMLHDVFTTDVLWQTALNMAQYLGDWGTILARVLRGPEGGGRVPFRGFIVAACYLHLAWCALAPGESRRRARSETALLIASAVVFVLVGMFYREHRDYQFVLLVPFASLVVARSLVALAARFGVSSPRVRCAAQAAMVVAWAALGIREHMLFWNDLANGQNAMLSLAAQRRSAEFLQRRGIVRPVTVTFYAVGQYEFLTDGAVRPLHAFNLFRDPRMDDAHLASGWRDALAIDGGETHHVLLPLGRNVVEERHFSEGSMRRVLLEQVAPSLGGSTLVATFANERGAPVLALYRVGPERPGR